MRLRFRFRIIPILMLSLLSSVSFAGYEVKKTASGTTLVFPSVQEKTLPTDSSKEKFTDHVQKQQFFVSGQDRILKATDSDETLRPRLASGLLSTISLAYSEHIALELRPDDIWLTISAVVSRYIDSHSEELRERFVDHQGKKELTVKLESPFLQYTNESHWQNFLELMTQEIDKNVKDRELKEFFVPQFSTTTLRDRVVGSIQLMSSTKAYFSKKFIMSCGLPKVTLLGVLEDWQNLRRKADYIRTLGGEMVQWHETLVPVLDQLIATYQGSVAEDFWERVCSSERLGSGGQKGFTGWFLVFAPFSDEGSYLLNSPEIAKTTGNYAANPKGVADVMIQDSMVEVPVILEDHLNREAGRTYHTVFYAGVSMPKYSASENTLRPSVDWAMIEKKEITLEALKEIYSSNLYNRNSNAFCLPLLDFAYHLAKMLHISNSRLLDLSNLVTSFYYNGREADTKASSLDRKNLQAFYRFLGDSKTYYYDRSPAMLEIKKAIVMDRMEEVVNSFKQ